MRKTVTVSLPEGVVRDLDRLAKSEGVSRSDAVRESLRAWLFVRKVRDLRRRLIPKAQARGIYTDQDVFDRVS